MRPFDTLELPGVYERTARRYKWITLGHIVGNMRRVLGLVGFGTQRMQSCNVSKKPKG